jgi:transposase
VEQTGFESSKNTKFDSLSREDLIQRQFLLEEENLRLVRELYEVRQIQISEEQLKLIAAEQLASLNETIYGASSERYKKPENKKSDKNQESPKPRIKKPSERYPNIPVREVAITVAPPPECDACGKVMLDSLMTENSEVLTVIPKKFEVIRYKRSIYRCSCQSCMKAAPAPMRIVEGSSYSNEMILDVVLSKYSDLIPIERYVQMASRHSKLVDLPPHSLIDLTHKFADFVKEVYRLIKAGMLRTRVLNADETPHKMLEGSEKKSWYLWGFSTKTLCYLECHDSRSGDVASEILLKSICEVLVSDVYSGYGKAIRVVNEARSLNSKSLIKSSYCNAHGRRYFIKAQRSYAESKFYLDHYHEIYQLEDLTKEKSPDQVLEIRSKMLFHFEAMKNKALEEYAKYPNGLKYKTALSYFLENYEGLTVFLKDPDVPIDNNLQERLLRSHVVGRKTWYGTHSERGAETAAILFSIIETCKLNDVNPRDYFQKLVYDLLNKKPAFTPEDFKNLAS